MTAAVFFIGLIIGAGTAAITMVATKERLSHIVAPKSLVHEARRIDLEKFVCLVCNSEIPKEQIGILLRTSNSGDTRLVCDKIHCLIAYSQTPGSSIQATLPT